MIAGKDLLLYHGRKNTVCKKEHYIPQFSMRPFEIAKGFCLTVNLEADTLEAKEKKTGNYYNNSKISN